MIVSSLDVIVIDIYILIHRHTRWRIHTTTIDLDLQNITLWLLLL